MGTFDGVKFKFAFSDRPDEESLPARFYCEFFENILRFSAERRHGAAFAVLPDEYNNGDPRLATRIKMKYCVESPPIWHELVQECLAYRRYFHRVAKQETASITDLKELAIWKDIYQTQQERIVALQNFVASLSGVDGIVVLTTGCRVLGFGGEIMAPDADLLQVMQAGDPAATNLTPVSADSFGTRHRSAFRLCGGLEDCLVLIVSQDGGARAVKKIGKDVVLWKDVDLRPFAL